MALDDGFQEFVPTPPSSFSRGRANVRTGPPLAQALQLQPVHLRFAPFTVGEASGAPADRPELIRMVGNLKPGEVVVVEKIDGISRPPLARAKRLVGAIRAKGARMAVPAIVDLSELVAGSAGVAHIVLEAA